VRVVGCKVHVSRWNTSVLLFTFGAVCLIVALWVFCISAILDHYIFNLLHFVRTYFVQPKVNVYNYYVWNPIRGAWGCGKDMLSAEVRVCVLIYSVHIVNLRFYFCKSMCLCQFSWSSIIILKHFAIFVCSIVLEVFGGWYGDI
jgi:hypothetical protein